MMHLLNCFGDIRVLMEVGIQTSNISRVFASIVVHILNLKGQFTQKF